MIEIAKYTFLPWLRKGITSEITGQTGLRAKIPINLIIEGDKVDGDGQITASITKEVQIYGPGDITGLDRENIIKVEPRHWITNFEPNYLPYIDFYDEDLPWRYSPLPNPDNDRLAPWLMLIILKEEEFKDSRNVKDTPLPFIELTEEAKLPDTEQLWAWAHVHINKSVVSGINSEDAAEEVSSKLETLLNNDPDLAYSRIICPRRLEEKQAYHAFLVPTFETGRRAGLGLDINQATDFSHMAWDAESIAPNHPLPYYHRWYFQSGKKGDFEYLVRLLKPQPIDKRVGIRDMDVQQPGANLKGLRDALDAEEAEKLHGILKLGGALQIPDESYSKTELGEIEKYRNWAKPTDEAPYPHPFQANLAAFINLTDSYETKTAATVNAVADVNQEIVATNPATEYDINTNPDPLITAPLYARWHALTQRLLKERDNTTDVTPNNNWVHQLNLDPRWRVAAGFGTKVIQVNQETYMNAAWDQIGQVLEANRKIRQAQLAKATTDVWYGLSLAPIQAKKAEKWLCLTAPVHARIVSDGKTVAYQKKQSRLTAASTSVNMRKVLRPRGKIARRLAFNENQRLDNLMSRINDNQVSAAPPKVIPTGIQSIKDLSKAAKPDNVPQIILELLEQNPWMKWIPLVLAGLLLLLGILFTPGAVLLSVGGTAIAGLIVAYRQLRNWSNQIEIANSLLEENQTPESVDDLPTSSDFRIFTIGENFVPSRGEEDSEEAQRFKIALKEVNTMLVESARLGEIIEMPQLEMAKVNQEVFKKLDPAITIPRWIKATLQISPSLSIQQVKDFSQVMAYPKFDLAMYEPLASFSAELFLPNINFIAQNSISLLETNQKFIESYMIGLNHEFARELLWREYPTDLRGSYFRQFWDVTSFLDPNPNPLEVESLKARFKKILDARVVIELQEFYDQLLDAEEPLESNFLEEAYRRLLDEELKDIKPIHNWSKSSNLGDHDNRELPGDNEEEVVLVIRGELLKKYPTAVIYAHRAVWQDEDGNLVLEPNQTIDLTKERRLEPIPEGEEDTPPTSIIKTPLYEAKVDPDIYFFGFDLTVCEAKGGSGTEEEPVSENCAEKGVEWRDPGWFFVIKERPGEPRFGLDIGEGGNIIDKNGEKKIQIWNDLSWGDLIPAVASGDFIQITEETPSVTATASLLSEEDKEKKDQQGEDCKVEWYQDMNAAELAYILYQVPILVAVHATEMLPDLPTEQTT